MKLLERVLERWYQWRLTRMSEASVWEGYVAAGKQFGDALSYGYMGTPLYHDQMLAQWQRWEAEYAKRGYRTISLDAFIEWGGWGKAPTDLGVRRKPGEAAKLHAEIYRKKYGDSAHRAPSILDSEEIRSGKPKSGMHELPGTDD